MLAGGYTLRRCAHHPNVKSTQQFKFYLPTPFPLTAPLSPPASNCLRSLTRPLIDLLFGSMVVLVITATIDSRSPRQRDKVFDRSLHLGNHLVSTILPPQIQIRLLQKFRLYVWSRCAAGSYLSRSYELYSFRNFPDPGFVLGLLIRRPQDKLQESGPKGAHGAGAKGA